MLQDVCEGAKEHLQHKCQKGVKYIEFLNIADSYIEATRKWVQR